jgi:cell division protein ZapE
MNLNSAFTKYCFDKKLLVNKNQKSVINLLSKFNYNNESSFLAFVKLFFKKSKKKIFYLSGDVGVGKTMILDFFFNFIDMPKRRYHFNEFMINFHDFRHEYEKKRKNNSIQVFVEDLKKKANLIYFDEFQVTNIVDAMILGKLFQKIFEENIKVIITSNTSIKDLYSDGLQREQFFPFINIMKNKCYEHELIIEEDYRKSLDNTLERFFYPLNEESNFKINQLFRKLTKGKKVEIKKLNIKGRKFIIDNYFEKITRFDFNDLCDKNIGAEDYIEISKECDFIVIENIPNFTDENSNKQQRFITLIDIVYDKKIPLMTSSIASIENFTSSKSLEQPFKRTLSRLYELTSLNISAIK